MLADDAVLDKLRFPMLASAKLDGIRAIVRDGVVYSRSNKPIPNKYVQEQFNHFEYFDGELIVGDPTAHDVYRQTTSHVMAHDKTDFPVRFFVFDHVEVLIDSYKDRMKRIHKQLPAKIIKHTQKVVTDLDDLVTYEEAVLEQGYEGLILRDPDAPYKMGRSTAREQYLLKLKRFVDAEFKVVGFEERQHNGNEATTNELGRTKRSSHKAGKTGRGDLGALILQLEDGTTFNCGTGFDDGLRQNIWDNRKQYVGQLAKIKYFPVGMKDLPRHPVFLGWRDKLDL